MFMVLADHYLKMPNCGLLKYTNNTPSFLCFLKSQLQQQQQQQQNLQKSTVLSLWQHSCCEWWVKVRESSIGLAKVHFLKMPLLWWFITDLIICMSSSIQNTDKLITTQWNLDRSDQMHQNDVLEKNIDQAYKQRYYKLYH